MRKFYGLLMAVLSVAFFGCSDDDNSYDENRIVGKWYDKYSTVAPASGLIFNSDHTGVSFYKEYSWDFVWTLDGSHLSTVHSEAESLNQSGDLHFNPNGEMIFGNTIYTSNPEDCYSGGSTNNPSTGSALSTLVGKTLNLYKVDGSYWMRIYHSKGDACAVDLCNEAMIAADYPPEYAYSPNGSKASYYLSFTTKTYIPLYGSFTYANFREDLTLTFESSTYGTYSGKQTNMSGTEKSVSGSFKIE